MLVLLGHGFDAVVCFLLLDRNLALFAGNDAELTALSVLREVFLEHLHVAAIIEAFNSCVVTLLLMLL